MDQMLGLFPALNSVPQTSALGSVPSMDPYSTPWFPQTPQAMTPAPSTSPSDIPSPDAVPLPRPRPDGSQLPATNDGSGAPGASGADWQQRLSKTLAAVKPPAPPQAVLPRTPPLPHQATIQAGQLFSMLNNLHPRGQTAPLYLGSAGGR